MLLHTMVKHETLTIDDLLKKENLGVEPNVAQAKLLISELRQDHLIEQLSDVVPETLTNTNKAMAAYENLGDADKQETIVTQL